MSDAWAIPMNLVEQLNERVCPDLGVPDHGHTDCWLHWAAAVEIAHLRHERDALASALRHIAHQSNACIWMEPCLTDEDEHPDRWCEHCTAVAALAALSEGAP